MDSSYAVAGVDKIGGLEKRKGDENQIEAQFGDRM